MNGRKTFAVHLFVGACVVGFLAWALADYWPFNIETPFNGYHKMRGFSVWEELAFIPQVIAIVVLGVGGFVTSIFVPTMFINQFVRGRERYHYSGYYTRAAAFLAPLALLWAGSLLIEVYLNGVTLMRLSVLVVMGASLLTTLAGVISNLVDPEVKWFGRQTSSDSGSYPTH